MSSIKESKVTLKGQIVIPKELREELDIKPGEKLLIKKIDRKVLLIPKPKEPIDFLIKIAKKVKLGNLRKEIKEFRKEVGE
jgi:AbrB family transcriptional regulator (stage V sporulation protein T)